MVRARRREAEVHAEDIPRYAGRLITEAPGSTVSGMDPILFELKIREFRREYTRDRLAYWRGVLKEESRRRHPSPERVKAAEESIIILEEELARMEKADKGLEAALKKTGELEPGYSVKAGNPVHVTRDLCRDIRAAVREAMGGGRWLVEVGLRGAPAQTAVPPEAEESFNVMHPLVEGEDWDLVTPVRPEEIRDLPDGAVELDCYVSSPGPYGELVTNVSVFVVNGRTVGAVDNVFRTGTAQEAEYNALKAGALALAGGRVGL